MQGTAQYDHTELFPAPRENYSGLLTAKALNNCIMEHKSITKVLKLTKNVDALGRNGATKCTDSMNLIRYDAQWR